MSELRIIRSLPADVSLGGSDGRTAVLKLLTYGRDYQVSDDGLHTYAERWKQGAFKRSLSHNGGSGLAMTYEHDLPGQPRSLPVGGSKRAWEETDGTLMLEGRISRTSTGDDLIELMRDGVVSGASIDCIVYRSTPFLGGIERVEARLKAIALTCVPQYDDAGLVTLRSEPDPVATPRLDALRERMAIFDS